ncbi:MAG: flagellar basal body P-ring formation chaperone FlgA [Paracoccaceae bacterium]
MRDGTSRLILWILIWILLWGLPGVALAESILTTRTIRPEDIIAPSDIRIVQDSFRGSYTKPEDVIGQEARVALYAGRPILRGDVRAPALVGRNDRVELVFRQGGLQITAEGRALSRAAVGETAMVLNITSRRRVIGRVMADGRVLVE